MSDTESIEESNIDEIVETLTNQDGQLIGYSCQKILASNVAEPMDIKFYMDLLTPKANTNNDGNSLTPQETAVRASQEILLREMSRQYGIEPDVSKGVRCFDLPVDGSTWIVQMTIDPRFFVEEPLFGGCRELQWNADSHDCKLYEAHLQGMYLGAVPVDRDGVPFSDVVTRLELLIGDKLPQELSEQVGGGLLGASNYETKFLGVPAPASNPNFQGGADQSRDGLNEPVNLNTAIEANYSQNRKTITVVGGLLVACFSVAFFLVGYILFNRRRSYRKDKNNDDDDDDDEDGGVEVVNNLDYEFDRGNSHDDDEDIYGNSRQEDIHYDEPGEYPNLPLSADAIQMDLGPAMRDQMMGSPPRTTSHFFSPERGGDDYHELDDSDRDSWAQPDGTIGSLELQLEPITAEV